MGGVLGMLGVVNPRRQLLPSPSENSDLRTRICLVNGTQDTYVDRTVLQETFGSYSGAALHWVDGVGHTISPEIERIGLEFLQSLLPSSSCHQEAEGSGSSRPLF